MVLRLLTVHYSVNPSDQTLADMEKAPIKGRNRYFSFVFHALLGMYDLKFRPHIFKLMNLGCHVANLILHFSPPVEGIVVKIWSSEISGAAGVLSLSQNSESRRNRATLLVPRLCLIGANFNHWIL